MQQKQKEALVLGAVVLIGVIGLLALQLMRRSTTATTNERAVVQAPATQSGATTDGQPQSTIQTIPGNLLDWNKQPEKDKPFTYRLGDFQPGAVYSLDPGDGSPRKVFDNGQLVHTYHGWGDFHVTLYASYQGQEVKLQTVTKNIAKELDTQATGKRTKKPLVDY